MNETTELATIPKETALSVFSADKGLDPYIAKIKAEVDGFIPDVTTKKGRDAIASMAYKVAKSKTYLDNCGKELVAELKQIPARIDSERKRMRDMLDAMKDDVRKPLTDWEESEANRISEIKQRIESFNPIPDLTDADSSDLQSALDIVNSIIIDESFAEFIADAARSKVAAVSAVTDALIRRKAHEEKEEELARLRKEAEEREQKERDERIAREAADAARIKAEQDAKEELARVEKAAQDERDAAAKREADAKAESDRRELELKLEAERSAREALEAQQRAEKAAQDERDKIAAEKAAEAEELAKREKDKEHKKKINNAAVSAFTSGGMTEECAKLAVTLIAKNIIPSIKINY